MARSHRRLTALSITRKKAAAYYADGDRLYLQVANQQAKSWVYRYMLAGRSREIGESPETTQALVEEPTGRSTARRLVRSETSRCWIKASLT